MSFEFEIVDEKKRPINTVIITIINIIIESFLSLLK